MASTKITDLPGANAVGTSVVPVSTAAGNATNKVTLASIAGLAPQLSDATPQAAGEPQAGVASTASRADHVHAVPVISYSNLTNVPSSFSPSAHSHAISDVTNLQTSLDGKAASSHSHGNLSGSGAIGSAAGSLVITGAGGVLETAALGTGLTLSGGVLSASDSRWNLFLPPAPTGLAAIPGNAQAALSWTAPSVAAQTPITDYVVQYSSNSGSTWTTFSDGTSTATAATVTGLTNGTAYVFRVAGVNGVGTGPYTSASASLTPAEGDQYFSNVALLLHGDGNLTDSSSYGRTVTANGNVVTSAAAKFGSASIGFGGSSSDYLTIPSDAATFTGDFALEAWIYPASDAAAVPWSILENAAQFNLWGNGTMEIYMGGHLLSINVGTVATEQWHHIAFVRSGSTTRGYFNGVLKGTGSGSGTIGSGANTVGLKTTFGAASFKGRIDDYRITIGSDRGYTGASIPVPVAAFPNS